MDELECRLRACTAPPSRGKEMFILHLQTVLYAINRQGLTELILCCLSTTIIAYFLVTALMSIRVPTELGLNKCEINSGLSYYQEVIKSEMQSTSTSISRISKVMQLWHAKV